VLNHPLAKRRRAELGLSLRQVGELVGVGKDVIVKWERGVTEPRDMASLRKYAEVLQVDLGELAAEPESEPVNAKEA
jgi:repressor LexA